MIIVEIKFPARAALILIQFEAQFYGLVRAIATRLKVSGTVWRVESQPIKRRVLFFQPRIVRSVGFVEFTLEEIVRERERDLSLGTSRMIS